MDEHEKNVRRRLKADFPHYAERCLKIRSKDSKIIPLKLNSVQWIIHKKLEKQKRETGMVRALILKARQPGCSTYVEGRFFHQTTHNQGTRAYILTHKDEATNNLFEMVKRYYDACPKIVRPEATISNAKELHFGLLDSSYRVGTAKAAGVGRSDTIQLFHGSEVAHWANAQEHADGVIEAVPLRNGTEVILESTANGLGGFFYSKCNAAMRGEGDYILIFIAWFTHDEYQTTAPNDWVPPPDFAELERNHELERDQTYWAYAKNKEMAINAGLPLDEICWKFQQEYPSTAKEAFQASATDSFISSKLVMAARKTKIDEQDHAALVIGCDFARGDNDWNWFIDRKGRIVGRNVNDRFHSSDTVEIANRLTKIIEDRKPQMCFLDTGGGGSAVYDILKDRGYGSCLELVNFGGKPDDDRKYLNKRAEMYGNGRDWLMAEGGADLPDDDILHQDICAPGYKENMNHQVVLEDKKEIRKRMGVSPDGGDAWALTFASTVSNEPLFGPLNYTPPEVI